MIDINVKVSFDETLPEDVKLMEIIQADAQYPLRASRIVYRLASEFAPSCATPACGNNDLDALVTSRLKDMHAHMEKERRRAEDKMEALKSQCALEVTLKTQALERERDLLAKQLDTAVFLRESSLASANKSVAQGKVGEETIAAMLNDLLANTRGREVIDTSQNNHEADICVLDTKTQKRLYLEVKNYTAAIQSKEVTKALSDLRGLREKHGADLVGFMFVSLRGKSIPGKGHLCFETIEGVPVVWMSVNLDTEYACAKYCIGKMMCLLESFGDNITGKLTAGRDAPRSTTGESELLAKALQEDVAFLTREHTRIKQMEKACTSLKKDVTELRSALEERLKVASEAQTSICNSTPGCQSNAP